MNSSRNNTLITLYKSGKTVFRLKDIALLTGATNFQSLNKKVHYLVKKNELINLRKGLYALHNYNKEELAGRVFSPTYLSIDYVLQKKGVIFQYDSTITSIAYLSRVVEIDDSTFLFRKIKNEILTNTSGIDIYDNGISIASPERAFLDYVYLNGDSYFDNIALLNKKTISKILPIYSSVTLIKMVKKLLAYA
jgi:hypothetical protein